MGRLILLLSLSVGPLATWLAWSVINRRWGQVVAAVLANATLWVLGPQIVVCMLKLIALRRL